MNEKHLLLERTLESALKVVEELLEGLPELPLRLSPPPKLLRRHRPPNSLDVLNEPECVICLLRPPGLSSVCVVFAMRGIDE